MDAELGVVRRMKVVASNLRKFGQLEGETAKIQPYHNEIIEMGQNRINETGIRNICIVLGDKYGLSDATIKSEYSVMKRYGLIKD